MSAGIQELVIDIPENEWLSANKRFGHPAQRASRVKRVRQRACLMARSQGLKPYGNQKVLINATVHGRVNRWSDPNNAADCTKPVIDGLRDAGVLMDDHHGLVVGPNHLYGEPISSLPKGFHRIVLTIKPIQEGVR